MIFFGCLYRISRVSSVEIPTSLNRMRPVFAEKWLYSKSIAIKIASRVSMFWESGSRPRLFRRYGKPCVLGLRRGCE